MKKVNLAFVLTIGLGITAQAAIVAADSASSSAVSSSGTNPPDMIDGTLSTDTNTFPTVTALTEANKLTLVSNSEYAWLGAGNGQFLSDDTEGETVTFAFTDATIGQVLIWNYSQNADRGLDAISKVEVQTNGTTWVDLNLTKNLLNAGDANFRAQSLDLGNVFSGVDGIRLTMQQADNGNGHSAGGFDEVAFSSIPEPASVGLIVAFGGSILFIRSKWMI